MDKITQDILEEVQKDPGLRDLFNQGMMELRASQQYLERKDRFKYITHEQVSEAIKKWLDDDRWKKSKELDRKRFEEIRSLMRKCFLFLKIIISIPIGLVLIYLCLYNQILWQKIAGILGILSIIYMIIIPKPSDLVEKLEEIEASIAKAICKRR